MTSRCTHYTSAAILVCVCAGCVTTSMQKEFSKLDSAIRERAGYDVEWADVSIEQETITSHVQSILDQELTADGAVQVALLNNRRLQAMYAEMGIQVGEFIQAGLLPNPVVDVAVRLRDDERTIEGAVVADFLKLLLIPMRRKFEGARLEAVQRQVQAEIIDLAAETRMAFYDYLAARQRLALAEDIALANAAAYAMAWQLRAAGNVPLIMTLKEREPFEASRLQLAEAEMEVLENRERMNGLMGLWGEGTQWETAALVPQPPEEEIDLANIESRAIESSLDLSISLMDLTAAARQLGIKRVSSILPQLKAGVDAERESDGEDIWWVGPTVQVEVPIFDQGKGRRAAARMEVRRRWELVTDLAIDIRSAARLAAYRLEYTRKRALFLNEVIVPLRHRVVLEMHLQYNAMFRGIFDLLREKEHELEISRDYIETLHEYWIARTQVEQLLMGRLYDVGAHRMGHASAGGAEWGFQRPGTEREQGRDRLAGEGE